jgi:hypothetical protein
VEADSHTYCAKCSGPILSTWKGWPNRNAVPLLPRIVDGACESCKASRPLPNRQFHCDVTPIFRSHLEVE